MEIVVNNWDPEPEIDAAVRSWLSSNGFEPDATDYDFDGEVYAWRDSRTAPLFTLRISRLALEHFSGAELTAALDREKVADLLRDTPRAYTILEVEGTELRVRQGRTKKWV